MAPAPAAERGAPLGPRTAALLAAFLVLHALARTEQIALADGDEYCRAAFSFEWARRPFFAPPDHVWLSGQFYVLGALFRLVGDLRPVVVATGLLGVGAAVYLCGRIARRMWDDPVAGFSAGLVAAANPVLLVTSLGASAEVFALPALMAGLDAWLAGLEERARPGASTSPTSGGRRFLAAAAWIGLGTTFRFELWYAAALLGGFLCLLARGVGGLRRASACALLSLFPACWLASSWIALGSPIQFAVDRARAVRGEEHPYDFSSPLDPFLFYARGLAEKHALVLLLVAAGAWLAWRVARRRALPLAAGWACLAGLSMLAASGAGMTARYPPRYVLFLLLPLIPFAGGPLAALARSLAARGRWGRAALLFAAAIALLASADQARRRLNNAWGADPALLGLAVRLEREHDAHRRPPAILFPRGTRLGVDARDRSWRPWMIQYHTNRPSEVFPLRDETELAGCLRSAPDGTRLLLLPPFPDPGARARRVEVAPPFELWEVLGPPPR
ncbi:MAG TPA: hypothetical protein VFI25_07755 [Planctomycetota bacterium]|jgi:hypothetical protein|nr:hypothetical protein [Planctomycetota bacterium]